jgi:signal transduction histidine kinase
MLMNAYESNERQLEIINQLLYVARLDAGRITLHRQRVDMAALLRTVARDQVESLQQRKHTLVYQLPKRPVPAWVDPHYMRMVLENLLSNAIKYTPEGGTISLGISRAHGEVAISVSDTGVGISSDAQPAIFEKFSRVENELSTDVNGSGVGLYLTRQIVSLHQGTIEVESVLGKGSTFIVHISDSKPIHKA